MGTLILNQKEIEKTNEILENNEKSSITFMGYVQTMGCDKYDCFFRGVQCPCEGICDGRA